MCLGECVWESGGVCRGSVCLSVCCGWVNDECVHVCLCLYVRVCLFLFTGVCSGLCPWQQGFGVLWCVEPRTPTWLVTVKHVYLLCFF